MIRVVLADDQTLVRQGIRRLLELSGEVEVLAEAEDGQQALEMVRRLRPQVLLLDVRMPKVGGLQVLEALRQENDAPRVILLTTFDDDAALLDGVRLGIAGYLLKDVDLDRLLEALRAVAGGGTQILPAITRRAEQYAKKEKVQFEAAELPDGLTGRELEVLRLLAGGYSNREIADMLGTVEGTVKNQVSSILSKLGVRDRTRAVLKSLELGWLLGS